MFCRSSHRLLAKCGIFADVMRIFMWIVASVLACLACFPVCAQGESSSYDEAQLSAEAANFPSDDSVRVSLLTCSPGQEVYSLYGHTAIRCVDYTRGTDVVFNYGVFSFSQPHFIWRFVLGKCDYMVDATYYHFFERAYAQRGSQVTEQVLNLTSAEANAVQRYLLVNCLPENCEYRYNFLYNNCTTMVRDAIERCVDGTVIYQTREPRQTTRQILHHYTRMHPWAAEGNDLLLGSAVDTIASDRSAMFAPELMMHYADNAQIQRADGSVRPLVSSTDVLVPGRDVQTEAEFPLSPRALFVLLLCLSVLLVLIEYLTHCHFTVVDVVFLALQGMVGVLLLFMALFSLHPAVDSNWLLWPLNPLSLLGLGVILLGRQRAKNLWWVFDFGVLTLFLLFYLWIPQDFGNIVVPLTMCLLTRPISFYLCNRKSRK